MVVGELLVVYEYHHRTPLCSDTSVDCNFGVAELAEDGTPLVSLLGPKYQLGLAIKAAGSTAWKTVDGATAWKTDEGPTISEDYIVSPANVLIVDSFFPFALYLCHLQLTMDVSE